MSLPRAKNPRKKCGKLEDEVQILQLLGGMLDWI